jgi:hypothetical protein
MNNETQRSRTTIAAEAVGERGRSATPDAAKEKAEMLPEEALRENAKPAGSQADRAATTAESVGERVGDAYSDAAPDQAQNRPGQGVRQAASGTADNMLAASRQAAQVVSHQFEEQPFMTAVVGFALGYIAALIIHGRR